MLLPVHGQNGSFLSFLPSSSFAVGHASDATMATRIEISFQPWLGPGSVSSEVSESASSLIVTVAPAPQRRAIDLQ